MGSYDGNQYYDNLENNDESLLDNNDNWVQYIDEDTGNPYLYNETTGESRWIEVQECKWDKYYDDDGNEFYYHRETGESQWEVPEGYVDTQYYYGGYEDQPYDGEYYNNNEYDGTVQATDFENETPQQVMYNLDNALYDGAIEHKADEPPPVSTGVMAQGSLFSTKSVNFSPMVRKASLNTFSEKKVSMGNLLDRHLSTNSLKSGISLVSRTASVADNLKPTTPLTSKKSGFTLLKQDAVLLRTLADPLYGDVWQEWQAANIGPIFYCKEGGESAGQWAKPDLFINADGYESTKSGHNIDLSSDSNISVEQLSVSNLDNQLSIPKPSLFGNFATNYGNHSTASKGPAAPKMSSPLKEKFPAPTTPKKSPHAAAGTAAGGSTTTPGVAMGPSATNSVVAPTLDKPKVAVAPAASATTPVKATADIPSALSPSQYSPVKPLNDLDVELDLKPPSASAAAIASENPKVDAAIIPAGEPQGLKKVRSFVPTLNLPVLDAPLHVSNPNASTSVPPSSSSGSGGTAVLVKAAESTVQSAALNLPPAHLLEKEAVAHDLKVQQSLDTSLFELDRLRKKTNEARLQWDKAVLESPAAGGLVATTTAAVASAPTSGASAQSDTLLSPLPKLGGTLEDEEEVKRFQKGAKPYEISSTKTPAAQQPSVVDPQDSVSDDILIDTLIAKKISLLQGQSSTTAAAATAATGAGAISSASKTVNFEKPEKLTTSAAATAAAATTIAITPTASSGAASTKSMKSAPSSNTLDNIAFFDSNPSFIVPKTSSISTPAAVTAAVTASANQQVKKDKPKAVPMLAGKPDFVQMYKRAQIVDQRWPWTCLFDQITETTFYRHEGDKTFQVEQPAAFDPVILQAGGGVRGGGSVSSVKPLPAAASSLPHVAASIQSSSAVQTHASPVAAAAPPKVAPFEYVKDHAAAEEVAALLSKSAAVTAPVVVSAPSSGDPSPAAILPGESASDMVARFKKDLLKAQQMAAAEKNVESDRVKSALLQATETQQAEVPAELVQKHLSLTDQLLSEKKAHPSLSGPPPDARRIAQEIEEEEERSSTFLTFSSVPNSLFYKGGEEKASPAKKNAGELPSFETRDGIYDEYKRPAGLDEEGLMKNLVFADRISRALKHDSYKDPREEDAQLLLHRLHKISEDGQLAAASMLIYKDNYQEQGKQCRQIVQRTCTLLETIDMSPVEHIMNRRYLLDSGVAQRRHLVMPRGISRDLKAYHSLPVSLCCPQSLTLEDLELHCGRIKECPNRDGFDVYCAKEYSLMPGGPLIYVRRDKKIIQSGENFDSLMRKSRADLARDNWTDYDLNVIGNQRYLQHRGVELLTDPYGGFVYYDPQKDLYSSTGAFPSEFKPRDLHTAGEGIPKKTSGESGNNGGPETLDLLMSASRTDWDRSVLTSALNGTLGLSGSGPVKHKPKVGTFFSNKNVWDQFQLTLPAHMTIHTRDISQEASGLGAASDMRLSANQASAALASLSNGGGVAGSQVVPGRPKSSSNKRNKAGKNDGTPLVSKSVTINESLNTVTQLQRYHSSGGKGKKGAAERLSRSLDIKVPETGLVNDDDDLDIFMRTIDQYGMAYRVPEIDVDTDEQRGNFYAAEMEKEMLATFADIDERNNRMNAQKPLLFEKSLDGEAYVAYHNLIVAIANAPDNPVLPMELMEFLLYQGCGKEALAAFKTALDCMKTFQFKPSSYDSALFHLLSAKLSLKYYSHYESLLSIETLIDMFPESPFVLTHAAIYFHRLKFTEVAEQLFVGVLLLDPHYDQALLSYSRLLIEKGNFKTAHRYLSRIETRSVFQSMAGIELAWLTELRGADFAGLSVSYRNCGIVASKDRSGSCALHSLGHQYQINGDPERAVEHYRRAIASDADNSIAYLLLAAQAATSSKDLSNARSTSVQSLLSNRTLSTTGSATVYLKHEADAHYRHGLAIMPPQSYRWIALLSYADYLTCVMRDFARAKEYYAEAVKLSQSYSVYPIVAYTHFLQYVMCDKNAVYRVLLLALRCWHESDSNIQSLMGFTAFKHAPSVAEQLHNADESTYKALRGAPEKVLITSWDIELSWLYLTIAYYLIDMSELSHAARYANAALQIQPTSCCAIRCMALITWIYNPANKKLALRYFAAAQDYGTDNPYALKLCAVVKATEGQFHAAFTLLDSSVRLASNCPLTYRAMGTLSYLYYNNGEQALAYLNKAFELSALEDTECVRLMGQILMDAGQFKQAKGYFLQTLYLVPWDSVALAGLAMCLAAIQGSSGGGKASGERARGRGSRQIAMLSSFEDLIQNEDPEELMEASMTANLRRTIMRNAAMTGKTAAMILTSNQSKKDASSDGSILNHFSFEPEIDVKQTAIELIKDVVIPNQVYYWAGMHELNKATPISFKKAKALFTLAATKREFSPPFVLALHMLGYVAEVENDLSTAELMYERALNFQPMDAVQFLRLVNMSEQKLESSKVLMLKYAKQLEKKQQRSGGSKLEDMWGGSAGAGGGGGGGGGSAKKKTKKKGKKLLKSKTEPVMPMLILPPDGSSDAPAVATRKGKKGKGSAKGSLMERLSEMLAMQNGEKIGGVEGDLFDGDDDDIPVDDEDSEEDEEDVVAKRRRAGDVPSNVAVMQRKLLLHQRMHELAMLNKYNSRKLLKKLEVPMGSHVYVDPYWLDRLIHAFGKCDDWSVMHSAANKLAAGAESSSHHQEQK